MYPDSPVFDCIVIGAGMAGIAAAQVLDKKGIQVLVVEARERIGGRIKTTYPGDGRVAVELGCQWIHGIDGNKNPLLHLIPEISQPTDHSKTIVYDSDGSVVPQEVVAKCSDAVSELTARMTESYRHGKRGSMAHFMHHDKEWNRCIFGTCPPCKPLSCPSCKIKLFFAKNLENVEAGPLEDLSIGEYAGEGGFHGDNVIPLRGYRHLLETIIEGLDRTEFKLGCEVHVIDYTQEYAILHTSQGILKAHTVISTLPLGVLKSKKYCPEFRPSLPHRLQSAIRDLGFGILNKAVLTFDKGFWPPDMTGFSARLNGPKHHGYDGEDKESMLWFFNLKQAVQANGDCNILVCYYAANVADWMEQFASEKVQEMLLDELGVMFGTENVTRLVSFVVTKWREEKYACGSYSYLSKASDFKDQAEFTKPIMFGKRKNSGMLVFAGEHTIQTHFATVHGALLSGQRAGRQVIQHVLSLKADSGKRKEYCISAGAAFLSGRNVLQARKCWVTATFILLLLLAVLRWIL
ncbi:hypothetical protein BDR26DRAFT_864868 [Obelidium mucronatum]|nr:hypothetical protein BDR26DRAFT_864868 [Obelidium mucronatum]